MTATMTTEPPKLRCETLQDWADALGYKNPRSIRRLMELELLPPRLPGFGRVLWAPGTIARFLAEQSEAAKK
jgi:hypothetical protein